MANYRLSNEAKDDLIRIHHYGVEIFGIDQSDKYFNSFFDYFEIIAQQPFALESVDYIKKWESYLYLNATNSRNNVLSYTSKINIYNKLNINIRISCYFIILFPAQM
jgi:plasmid stabilization system protein ParE